MDDIKFGTSGWRALYHVDFTIRNVTLVCQAIAEEALRSSQRARGVAVGYDVRFMGRQFAQIACEVLAANGIKSFLMSRDVPTPVLSHIVVEKQLAGAINFTASHNPFEYNGIKYSPESGGPALPEATRRIEARIAELQAGGEVTRLPFAEASSKGLVETCDPRHSYFQVLDRHLRTGEFMRLRDKRIAVDCKYAVARGYLDEYLSARGANVISMHATADPYFNYEHPEPSAGHVDELQEFVADNHDVAIGLACDGDADRFGIVDSDGTFVEANLILALLLDYLVKSRGWTGGVARSVATTHLIDAVAKLHGLKVYETPVGFKFIGDLLVRGEIILGGEESAGLTIKDHLPEKDGILACLLVVEMMAATGHTLSELIFDLFARTGRIMDARKGLRLTDAMERTFAQRIADPPSVIGGKNVLKVDRTDGTKLLLEDDEWVLLRKSGTEPLVRLYAEAASPERLDALMRACEAWLAGGATVQTVQNDRATGT